MYFYHLIWQIISGIWKQLSHNIKKKLLILKNVYDTVWLLHSLIFYFLSHFIYTWEIPKDPWISITFFLLVISLSFMALGLSVGWWFSNLNFYSGTFLLVPYLYIQIPTWYHHINVMNLKFNIFKIELLSFFLKSTFPRAFFNSTYGSFILSVAQSSHPWLFFFLLYLISNLLAYHVGYPQNKSRIWQIIMTLIITIPFQTIILGNLDYWDRHLTDLPASSLPSFLPQSNLCIASWVIF